MASPQRDQMSPAAGKLRRADDTVFDATEALADIIAGDSQVVATGPDDTAEVILSLDTSAYAAGDVLADTQVMTAAFRANGGTMILHNVQVFDLDDQAGALTLVFLRSNTSIGTENGAPSIADGDADEVIATVEVSSSAYVDFVNWQIAEVANIGKLIKAASDADDLYIAALSNDTKTYTAAGIVVRVGLLRN